MVNSIRPHYGPGEFLDQVIILIRAFSGCQGRKFTPFAISKLACDQFQGLIPAGFLEGTVYLDEGSCQAVRMVDKTEAVASFDAQVAVVRWPFPVTMDTYHPVP